MCSGCQPIVSFFATSSSFFAVVRMNQLVVA
jgi:hypothetical protein